MTASPVPAALWPHSLLPLQVLPPQPRVLPLLPSLTTPTYSWVSCSLWPASPSPPPQLESGPHLPWLPMLLCYFLVPHARLWVMIHLLVSLLAASALWSWGGVFYPHFNSPAPPTGVVLATHLIPSPLPIVTFSQSRDLTLRMTQSVLLRSMATLKSIDLLLVTASQQRQMTHVCVTQRECSTAGKMACVPAGGRGFYQIWVHKLLQPCGLPTGKHGCKSSSVCGERDCLAELYETSVSGIPSKRLLLNNSLINYHLFHAYTMVIGTMVSILPINYIFYSHSNVILPTSTTKTITSTCIAVTLCQTLF